MTNEFYFLCLIEMNIQNLNLERTLGKTAIAYAKVTQQWLPDVIIVLGTEQRFARTTQDKNYH